MFPHRYFPSNYFARRYFPEYGAVVVPLPPPLPTAGVWTGRRRPDLAPAPPPPTVRGSVDLELPVFLAQIEAAVTPANVSLEMRASLSLALFLDAEGTMHPASITASIALDLQGRPTLESTCKAIDPKKRRH